MTFKLISCDGGGVRGYISSGLIKDLNTETNGKLLGSVSGFAGTSTGGLIAIALAYGVSIDVVHTIYSNPKKIFTPDSILGAEECAPVGGDQEEGALDSGPGYFYTQYTSKGLHDALYPHVHDATLRDIKSHNLLAVNTVRLDDLSASPHRWYPTTLNNRGTNAYQDVKLIDACLATSAAPTYFPPHEISGYGFFADGGTYANNPVMNGYEVARQAGEVNSLDDIEIISFGTGLSPQKIPTSSIPKPLDWGTTTWLRPDVKNHVPQMALLNMALDNSAENLTEIAKGLFGKAMVRLNPVLKNNVPLDGVSHQDMVNMDIAIAAAKASPEWQAAKKMIAAW